MTVTGWGVVPKDTLGAFQERYDCHMNPENQIMNPCPNPETPEHLFNDAGAPGRLHFSSKKTMRKNSPLEVG